MAEYTIEYNKAIISETLLATVVANYASSKGFLDFGTYFAARWNIYEIYTTDTDDWFARFKDRFTLLSKKYQEKITAYATEIQVLDGKKLTTTYNTADTSSSTDTYEGTTTLEDTTYGLPNKSVSQPKGYPTEIRDGSTNQDSESTRNINKTKGGTITVTGRENTADLRENYINKIRDLMAEFVNEFSPIFITLF